MGDAAADDDPELEAYLQVRLPDLTGSVILAGQWVRQCWGGASCDVSRACRVFLMQHEMLQILTICMSFVELPWMAMWL